MRSGEHGALPGQGYRNGYRRVWLKTAEGLMDARARPPLAEETYPVALGLNS